MKTIFLVFASFGEWVLRVELTRTLPSLSGGGGISGMSDRARRVSWSKLGRNFGP